MITVQQVKDFGGIGWHKQAAKALERDKIYIVGNLDYTKRIYILNNNNIECVATGITAHRAKQVKRAFLAGKWENIPQEIRENYTTNGYTTRRGLFADYSAQMPKMAKIALSHAQITDSGKAAHDMRVILRNS